MKKITQRLQTLGQKATELRHVIESVPPKVVEIREAVTAATGQVQKLRADIVSSVATLRSENDTLLVTALHEIDQGTEVLAQAGVRLEGVDMDLGASRRLVVRLERVVDVDAARLQALLAANRAHPAVHALLSAVLKADELAANVELTHLDFKKLTVEVGLIPSVRIGWRTETADERPHSLSRHVAQPAPTPISLPTASTPPAVSATPVANAGFFERRTAATVAAEHEAPAPTEPTAASENASPTADATSPDAHDRSWGPSSLQRFKKMPDLGKVGR